MATGILSILAALIPFVIWLWKRKAAQHDDPVAQHRARVAAIDRQLADADPLALTVGADADLDDLERLRAARAKAIGPQS